jgi:uncharacterized protein (TIGR00369 family)
LSIGWLGVLADEAAGRPLILNIPPGTHCPSQSLHFDLVQPSADMSDRLLTARGTIVRVGDNVSLTRFVIEGAAGTPLVVGTMRNALLPNGFDPATMLTPEAEPVGAAGDRSNLQSLLGTVLREQGAGHVRLEWTPRPQFGNPVGSVHGGVHVALADVALTAAVTTERPNWVLLGLDVSYHRPILLNGGRVSIEAAALHGGRKSVVAEATVRAHSGKALTTARATFVPEA